MCYVVPTASAIVTSIMWKKNQSVKVWWLNLMFIGGALFGGIDHLWNGELFLVGKNTANDILLGVVISAFIVAIWGAILFLSKYSPTLKKYVFFQK